MNKVIRVNFSREGTVRDRWSQMLAGDEFDYVIGYQGKPMRRISVDVSARLMRGSFQVLLGAKQA